MPATPTADIHSFERGFIFYTARDVPSAFVLQKTAEQLAVGLYLPGTNSTVGIVARSHILRLLESCIMIDEHPQTVGQKQRLPLNALSWLEVGHLIGERWFAILNNGDRLVFPYSVADQPAVTMFLCELRSRAMPRISQLAFVGAAAFGAPLTVKFACALDEELECDERMFLSLFNPHHRKLREHLTGEDDEWQPADYVGISPRRILWISDRHNQQRQLGGVVVRSGSIFHLGQMVVSGTHNGHELLSTVGGVSWRIPLGPESVSPAKNLVAEVDSVLAEVARAGPGSAASEASRRSRP